MIIEPYVPGLELIIGDFDFSKSSANDPS